MTHNQGIIALSLLLYMLVGYLIGCLWVALIPHWNRFRVHPKPFRKEYEKPTKITSCVVWPAYLWMILGNESFILQVLWAERKERRGSQ